MILVWLSTQLLTVTYARQVTGEGVGVERYPSFFPLLSGFLKKIAEKLQADTYTHTPIYYMCTRAHVCLYVYMKFILTKYLIMEETHD